MQAEFVQRGAILDYTTANELAAGDVVFIGDLAGVTSHPVPAGATAGVSVEGVYAVAKASATVFALGAKVYFSTTTHVATATTTDKLLGVAVAAGANGEETVLVKINA